MRQQWRWPSDPCPRRKTPHEQREGKRMGGGGEEVEGRGEKQGNKRGGGGKAK